MKRSRHLLIFLLALSIGLISGTIDLNDLPNYADQPVPNYITKDNGINNPITDEGAALGRVLFYDKQLSLNGSISCGSCHLQEFGFSDTAQVSLGLDGGVTGRHAMRLINARFGDAPRFFWDRRAATLEDQVTQPIQDHIEMGFSGTNGQPSLDSLISRMGQIDYYDKLFKAAFGDEDITEERMQMALAQFIRSIQSFDSRYDVGRAIANNDGMPFQNFTMQENMGKNLFLSPPVFNANGERIDGGAGCQSCHRAPEFDIDPLSHNNGVIRSADGTGRDITNNRAPSLRDLLNPQGQVNGPMMHTGSFPTLLSVIEHYDSGVKDNLSLDRRLAPGGSAQQLNLTTEEKEAMVAFLMTLTGQDVYTNEKWSDPFDENGNLEVLEVMTNTSEQMRPSLLHLYPNPVSSFAVLDGLSGNEYIQVLDGFGKVISSDKAYGSKHEFNLGHLRQGIYFVMITASNGNQEVLRLVKN